MSRRLVSIALVVALALFIPDIGAQPVIGGCKVFPQNMIFNSRVDSLPVHPQSQLYINAITPTKAIHLDLGTDTDMTSGSYYGIPYNTVAGNNNWKRITWVSGWPDESDCGTFASPHTFTSPCADSNGDALPTAAIPVPTNPLVEGNLLADSNGNDHHMLIVDTDTCHLWEVYSAYRNSSGQYLTDGAVSGWNLSSTALRTNSWTSSDAAGLPVAPLLIRQDEAASGTINHGFRFTLISSYIRKGEPLWPARHNTGTGNATKPKMGQIFRLKSSFNIPTQWSTQSKAVATALKQYGMYLSDIGSNLFIQGEPNANWDPNFISELQTIRASDLEAVCMDPILNASSFDPDSGAVPNPLAPITTCEAPVTTSSSSSSGSATSSSSGSATSSGPGTSTTGSSSATTICGCVAMLFLGTVMSLSMY